jgi:hypothetical protein
MSDDPAVSPLEYLPLLAPNEPPEITQKRLRGGQPGNLNALKHGLYVRHASIYNNTPIERSQLNDLNEVITHFKQFIEHLFQLGIASKDLQESNITLRSLALASMALTRLVHTQEKHFYISLDDDFRDPETNTSSFPRIYRSLLKNLAAVMDVSDLENDFDEAFNKK